MKEELGILAVKTFPELFPDAWKHDKGKWDGWDVVCGKCGDTLRKGAMGDQLVETPESRNPCTVPTPIKINWDNAMMLAHQVSPLEFMRAMVTIYIRKTGVKKPTSWEVQVYLVKPECTPSDFILAAIRAREAE